MRKLRVCIYGGTDLNRTQARFVALLTNHLLKALPNAVIVTGGVRYRRKDSGTTQKGTGANISSDKAALRGARFFAGRKHLPNRYEAWIPTNDNRPYIKRMTKSVEGCKVVDLDGRTAFGRRLRMVRDVDVVITIRGKTNTETVLEQALEIGRPALPLPFLEDGRDREKDDRGEQNTDNADPQSASRRFWNNNGERIEHWFPALGKHVSKLKKFTLAHRDWWPDICDLIVDIVKSARLEKCLTLLPFSNMHKFLYDMVIEPAIEEHMFPVRLDKTAGNRSIGENFRDEARQCRAVIADVTVTNLNVMYEVGYADASQIPTLLFTTEPFDPNTAPLYLRNRNIHYIDEPDKLKKLIQEHLKTAKDPLRRAGGR